MNRLHALARDACNANTRRVNLPIPQPDERHSISSSVGGPSINRGAESIASTSKVDQSYRLRHIANSLKLFGGKIIMQDDGKEV